MIRRLSLFFLFPLVLGPKIVDAQVAEGRYDYVTSVLVRDDNYVAIKLWTIGVGAGFRAPQGQACGNPGFGEFRYPLTDARTVAWMRLAIMSMVTRTKVYVLTDGCMPPRPGAGASVVSIKGFAACLPEGTQCP
jgi:hypothetical protein